MDVSRERLERGFAKVVELLLAQRTAAGHWEGELSCSPLSTATAMVALAWVQRARSRPEAAETAEADDLPGLIAGGARFLVNNQNSDGGWGDTLKSFSNISTTMLAYAALRFVENGYVYRTAIEGAGAYVERAGGVAAIKARYGKDHTFSVPILTHGALSGIVPWNAIPSLPFELACLPHQFYKWVSLPVVSYALPALIAIGQTIHRHRPPWNPVLRWLRNGVREPSLRVLQSIQPTSGGFLEATPLTAFVTMSLASLGLTDHPVVRKGVEFLRVSVRSDGSWPIDTNLATWVTTLSMQALGEHCPNSTRLLLADWLLGQQYKEEHPYTHADPGGWAWTQLSGGVPDADDTPSALLALHGVYPHAPVERRLMIEQAAKAGAKWLLDLQNRDGGWPTFCRGWGYLPFDRSASDLTAHALRALDVWRDIFQGTALAKRLLSARRRGFNYLRKQQRQDGSWLPLWFGNQHCNDDENATYGTARVLAAYRDLGTWTNVAAERGVDWLLHHQNPDGGWGGRKNTPSSVEETALAVESLAHETRARHAIHAGVVWLLERIENNTIGETSPIGFYFAKLWYYEKLYPLIFATASLRRVLSAW